MQIIVEDADGEVIKTYDLPTGKPESQMPDLIDQSLKYMGLKPQAKAGETSKQAGEAGGEGSGAAGAGTSAKAKKDQDEAEDDRHIRFTIGGEGRRLNKEDFCREMQKLDARTRKEVVAKSSASPAVKRLATQERTPAAGPEIRTTAPSESSVGTTPQGGMSRHGSAAGAAGGSTGAQQGREERKLAPPAGAAEDDETPAERRRREAALGITAGDESDEETERRGIRFAD